MEQEEEEEEAEKETMEQDMHHRQALRAGISGGLCAVHALQQHMLGTSQARTKTLPTGNRVGLATSAS